jgi:putative tryptophan/tyrosine transport system substrate-binding protein
MRRREFITLLGIAATFGPHAARAQQTVRPVIGFLRGGPLAASEHIVDAFRRGLAGTGYVDRQNIQIEYHAVEDQSRDLPGLIAELTRRNVVLMVGNTPAAGAAKAAGVTVPFVFASGSDPVRDGIVSSLNRPGGNVTGVVFFNAVLGAKRVELLRQIVPGATTFAMLVNPNLANTGADQRETQAAAQSIGKQFVVFEANTEREIDTVFAALAERRPGGLLIGSGGFLNSHREKLVALAARHAIPAIYAQREAVVAGGLMSYGTSITGAYRQAGVYAGRILKGEKPGDLPVMQSSTFEFVINLKTAKALRLEFHPQLLATADEVIE